MNEDKHIIKFCSCSSGSSGNSYIVAMNDAAILVDAGTTGKNMIRGLEKCGLTPADVDAIFLTHEHHDHIRGLPVIVKEINKQKLQRAKTEEPGINQNYQGQTIEGNSLEVYGSAGTIAATEEKLFGKTEFSDAKIISSPLEEIIIGDMRVTSFRLSHDAAEPFGYRIDAHGKSLAIVTDTGYVTDSIMRNILDVDFLVLEANHEKNILLMGRYPYELKMRILGDYGHLSNEAASEALIEILNCREKKDERLFTVALAHLSNDNNTPDVAALTIKNNLFEGGFFEERDYTMTILHRDVVGEVISI